MADAIPIDAQRPHWAHISARITVVRVALRVCTAIVAVDQTRWALAFTVDTQVSYTAHFTSIATRSWVRIDVNANAVAATATGSTASPVAVHATRAARVDLAGVNGKPRNFEWIVINFRNKPAFVAKWI